MYEGSFYPKFYKVRPPPTDKPLDFIVNCEIIIENVLFELGGFNSKQTV